MATVRPVFVVAGVGNASGTGAAAARVFAKAGYTVALIARSETSLKNLSDEINSSGGNAASFTIPSYSKSDIANAFSAIRAKFSPPSFSIRAALWNAGHGVFKPFFDITFEELQESLDTNIVAPFAFAREAISTFKENEIDTEGKLGGRGKRGTLLFTGATASLRGNTTTSAFAAGKHGLRALSQSLAKEFGKQNIHVAHVIIDGGILTDRSRAMRKDTGWAEDENVRLSPESIAKSYLFLNNQDSSALTWELDLRPAHEKW